VASLNTVGGQVVVGLLTVQYFFADLLTRRFMVGEFVQQGALVISLSAKG
jgi:phospholipid/cholesterol/gamma-HCH transport system permease protein